MVTPRFPPSSAPVGKSNFPATPTSAAKPFSSSQPFPSSSQRLQDIQEALANKALEFPRTQAPPGTKRHVASQERLENIKAALKNIQTPIATSASPLIGDCAKNDTALTSGTKRPSSSCPAENPPASKRRHFEALGDKPNNPIELDDTEDTTSDLLFIEKLSSDAELSHGYLETKTFDVTMEQWKAESRTSGKRPKGHYVRGFFRLYPRFTYDPSKMNTLEWSNSSSCNYSLTNWQNHVSCLIMPWFAMTLRGTRRKQPSRKPRTSQWKRRWL